MKMCERIKELRLQNNLTQEELGAKIGVKKAAIQKYENGSVSNLKRSNIKLLAEALGVSPTHLMGWDEFDNNHDTTSLSKESKILNEVKLAFGSDAIELMITYLKLNTIGKEKTLDYINDLYDQPKYLEVVQDDH
jgi:transcriptional regulator with XRE-family HTH domain